MTPRRPSRPWRVVYTTPGAPVYEQHRSQRAAYRAIEAEKQRVAGGTSRVVRMAVEQWDGLRWQRVDNAWSKTSSQETS